MRSNPMSCIIRVYRNIVRSILEGGQLELEIMFTFLSKDDIFLVCILYRKNYIQNDVLIQHKIINVD